MAVGSSGFGMKLAKPCVCSGSPAKRHTYITRERGPGREETLGEGSRVLFECGFNEAEGSEAGSELHTWRTGETQKARREAESGRWA